MLKKIRPKRNVCNYKLAQENMQEHRPAQELVRFFSSTSRVEWYGNVMKEIEIDVDKIALLRISFCVKFRPQLCNKSARKDSSFEPERPRID